MPWVTSDLVILLSSPQVAIRLVTPPHIFLGLFRFACCALIRKLCHVWWRFSRSRFLAGSLSVWGSNRDPVVVLDSGLLLELVLASMVVSWNVHGLCSTKCMCGGEKLCRSGQCGSNTSVGHWAWPVRRGPSFGSEGTSGSTTTQPWLLQRGRALSSLSSYGARSNTGSTTLVGAPGGGSSSLLHTLGSRWSHLGARLF
jgi:hypothetical protein